MGAAKLTESILSIMPPWPVIIVPQSFAPKSRLTAESTRPPRKPITTVTNASPYQRGARRASDKPFDGLRRTDDRRNLGLPQ